MIDRLIEIIGREASLFESFLALFEQQQKLLVANDAEGLKAVTEQLREKLVESRLLNEQREDVIGRVKSEQQIEGDLNVSRLLEIVDDSQASQLMLLRDLITSLNDKIAHTRNQNALLLNKSREYIAKMMAMLSKVSRPEPSYQPGGADQQVYNVALDRRV